MRMKHINENQREVGLKDYWGTDNPDIVVETTTISQEIHLDKLKAEIERLEQEIISAQPIDLPEELLDELNQAMTSSLNDGGQTFQKISDIVYAQNDQGSGHAQAELDRLTALLAKVTQ